MQNNVTNLSQKLQRSLDNNYNVVDMPAVIEIISSLEKTAVTKELLETTRLAKYINELRRKTTNPSLAKRAKDLLKKWRNSILPDAMPANNGQIRSSSAMSVSLSGTERSDSPLGPRSSKKRPASSTPPDSRGAKRALANGQREFEFSDNSNCFVKDSRKCDVIFINSDSNSSLPEITSVGVEPYDMGHSNDAQDGASTPGGGTQSLQPKKRGRKKGSKNHKNLVIAAEESFTNKMAVSRNSKVKTTQELLADLQNRTVATPPTAKVSTHQDIQLRAAQLTESLSRIDQKLNPQKQLRNASILRPSSNHTNKTTPHRTPALVSENWSARSSPEIVTNITVSDDEIVDVEGTDTVAEPPVPAEPLTVESLLGQLPPIDLSFLTEEDEDSPVCQCPLPPVAELPNPQESRITVQIVGDGAEPPETSVFAPPSPEVIKVETSETGSECDSKVVVKTDVGDSALVEDASDSELDELLVSKCPAKLFLRDKYNLDVGETEQVPVLHSECVSNVNGNFGASSPDVEPADSRLGDPNNIVPSLSSQRLSRTQPDENFDKYSISIGGSVDARPAPTCDRTDSHSNFHEWHETLDLRSYNDELLRVLPYVIID